MENPARDKEINQLRRPRRDKPRSVNGLGWSDPRTRLAAHIADTLVVVASARERMPPAGDPPALAELFRILAATDSARERAEAEDLIWALWYCHEDPQLERRMNKAIGALARRELVEVEPLLDGLVRDAPGWAEAWNKRATLYYLLERDAESVLDIQRTLQLEPRHFGAMSGFGQICLRAGDDTSALLALELALRVNPNLDAVRETAERLRGQVARVVH